MKELVVFVMLAIVILVIAIIIMNPGIVGGFFREYYPMIIAFLLGALTKTVTGQLTRRKPKK